MPFEKPNSYAIKSTLRWWFRANIQEVRREWRLGWPKKRAAHPPTTGTALFAGQMRPRGEPLVAPLTGETCVYYRLVIDTPQSVPGWPFKYPLAFTRAMDVDLVDESGTIVIRLEAADVALPGGRTLHRVRDLAQLDSADSEAKSFIDRYREIADHLSLTQHLQIRQEIIRPGATGTLIGRVGDISDNTPRIAAHPQPLITDQTPLRSLALLLKRTLCLFGLALATILAVGML